MENHECNITDTGEIWHKRHLIEVGHININGQKMLNLSISSKSCAPCMETKATRLPFKETKHKKHRRIIAY